MKKGIAFAIAGAGILFIILGIALGDVGAVLSKATYICLECIGIG